MSYINEARGTALIDDYVVDVEEAYTADWCEKPPIGDMYVTEVNRLDAKKLEVTFEDYDNDEIQQWTFPIKCCLADREASAVLRQWRRNLTVVKDAATTLCRWWRRRVTSSA